jgi:hypothetical protein
MILYSYLPSKADQLFGAGISVCTGFPFVNQAHGLQNATGESFDKLVWPKYNGLCEEEAAENDLVDHWQNWLGQTYQAEKQLQER